MPDNIDSWRTKKLEGLVMQKCPICGRFMRRINIAERASIEAFNGGGKRAYICIKETFYKLESRWEHSA